MPRGGHEPIFLSNVHIVRTAPFRNNFNRDHVFMDHAENGSDSSGIHDDETLRQLEVDQPSDPQHFESSG